MQGKRGRKGQAGFTVIEVVTALGVLAIGLVGTTQAFLQIRREAETTRNLTIASEAARAMVEDLQSTPFEDIFASFNTVEADDPGPNAPGSTFAVTGITLADGTPAGEIAFPVDAAGVLREDLDLPEFSLPKDLNGDGVIDGDDRRNDYVLLPIRVRVRWDGPGNSAVEYRTLLCDPGGGAP